MSRGVFLALASAAVVLVAPTAFAHDVQSAYLTLRQTGGETYDVVWAVPATTSPGELRPVLPNAARVTSPPARDTAADVTTERWSVQCPGGLGGTRVSVDGMRPGGPDVIVRVEHPDGSLQLTRLAPAASSFVVEGPGAGGGAAASAGRWQLAATYFAIGFEHILLGVDHLLFVLGLLVLVGRRWGMMLKTVTAFTVAHSLTLAVATLGAVRVAPAPLNALVALSILFLGAEMVRQRRGRTSFTIERPWLAAFAFGLVHGFGYASGLSAVGLPRRDVLLALLLFNLGVEAGQLAFVALYLAVRRSLLTLEVPSPRWATALPAYVVGTSGAYWTIAQTALFFQQP